MIYVMKFVLSLHCKCKDIIDLTRNDGLGIINCGICIEMGILDFKPKVRESQWTSDLRHRTVANLFPDSCFECSQGHGWLNYPIELSVSITHQNNFTPLGPENGHYFRHNVTFLRKNFTFSVPS
jgi:hypothetical protein